MPATAQPFVLKLKITLLGTKPPIWRRLLVPETVTLTGLSEAIQEVMGWHGYHLHAFEIAGGQFGDPKMLDEAADQSRYRLSRLMKDGVRKFTYTYDFGDNWEHSVVVEGREPAVSGVRYPACVAGKRNGPPEDCGGPWGFQELLEILATPDHPERAERLECVGGTYDPDDFNVQVADARLAARFGSSAGRGKSGR